MGNAYLAAAKERQKNQAEIKAVLSEQPKTEKLNITLPSEYKRRLKEYCKENYTSPAAFIRMCIDEKC